MDIYNFIRSHDVADYCRKINKTWNTFEMAIIIGHSYFSADKKREAWRELIANYPDMTTIPNRHKDNFNSIHEELTTKINSADKKMAGDYYEFVYVDIPTPFKRGDILIKRYNKNDTSDVFVLDWIDSDYPEQIEKNLKKYGCDSYISEGSGLFVGNDGILYSDHTHNNDCYEYYRGKLEGNQKLLHYVSLFINDKIGLPALLIMQCRIFLEHQLNNNLPIDVHGCCILENLLVENRLDFEESER